MPRKGRISTGLSLWSISNDLSDDYRRVIERNNRLKKFHELQAPELLICKAKGLIQKAVDDLMEYKQFWPLLKDVLWSAGGGPQ